MTPENIYKKIRHLTQYKDKTDEQVMRIAEAMAWKQVDEIDINMLFSDTKERKQARELLRKYLKDWSPPTVSEKNDLKQVIYFETIMARLQDKMNRLKDKDLAIPTQLIDSLIKTSTRITELKEKLGLNVDKDKSKDSLKDLELLKTKMAKWREENQGTRTLNCPYCGQMVCLKIKTDSWDATKHPFFKDRLLTNTHLLELYRKEKITKQDVALILECSTDYVSWIIEKHGKGKV